MASYLAMAHHMSVPTKEYEQMTFKEAGCVQEVLKMAQVGRQKKDRLRLNMKADLKKVMFWANRWKGSKDYDVTVAEGGGPEEDYDDEDDD
jgi:hypothetical protein